jgi:DNA-binding Lrp family transcriptional regulator
MHQDADDAIIAVLIEDTRATHTRIAETIGLPPSTVRARLGRIIRSGRVVPSILVHPDVEAQHVVYMLRVLLLPDATAEDLLAQDEFSSSPWAAQSAVSGLVFVQMSASSVAEMLREVDRARRVDGVDELSYSLVTRVYVGHSWRPRSDDQTDWASAPTRLVDATDRLLISSLRVDGRASYTELARVSGLTVAATRRRVLRLVEDGVIRFATRVEDGVQTDQEASVDLVVGAGDVPSFIRAMTGSPAVRYVIEQSGEFNVACYAVAQDTAGLSAAVAAVTGDPRVRRFTVDPFMVLRDRVSWTAP